MGRTRRTILVSLVAAGALLTLGACAPAKQPTTHPSIAHTSGGGSSHTTAPTSAALANPSVRVLKSCDQLVPAAALTAALGASAPIDNSPLSVGLTAPVLQDGALLCHWSDNPANDNTQTSNHLDAFVMPDVNTADWTDSLTTLKQIGEAATTSITGDAYDFCASSTGTTDWVCTADTRIGTTWISFEIESTTKSFATAALALAHFAPLLNSVVATATASGVIKEPVWHDPNATPVPPTCPTALPDSEVEAVSGTTGVDAIGPDLSDQQSLALYDGVLAPIGWVECDLASGDESSGFFATILPGGGWNWATDKAADASKPGLASVPSLGTQAFTYTDSDSNTTVIEWVRGDNLCTISVGLPVVSKEAAEALALATYLNGKIAA